MLEDGKLELSMREPGYLQIHIDCDSIMKKLKEAGGFLPFNDSSSSDAIRNAFGMSKNSFKRAIGHLYKEQQISLTDQGIALQNK